MAAAASVSAADAAVSGLLQHILASPAPAPLPLPSASAAASASLGRDAEKPEVAELVGSLLLELKALESRFAALESDSSRGTVLQEIAALEKELRAKDALLAATEADLATLAAEE